ncbi:hypothetical protein DXG01_008633 [Tephrocybe rancida]|nr:hypothetical protein DXG01_008633 [Tephrocybe rancida]
MAFASGSGFGQAANNQSNLFAKPAGSGAFGMSTQQSTFGQPAAQQQPAGGLFGQPAQQQQPQQSTGGLFGQTTQAPANSPFGQPAGQQQATNAFGQSVYQQTAYSPFGQPLGQQALQQPSGGLFGQQMSQPPAQQPAGIFGQSTAPAGGGLFGQPAAQPSTSGGGLFGQPPAQNASGGGLFGQPAAQPAGGGGLFGQSTTQTTGGGLFGQQAAQPATGGGLFGQSTTQPPGGGLFGQSTTQNTNGGLFGQSTTQPSGGGIFGGSTQQTQPTLTVGGFGGGLFGSTQPQQSQASNGPLLAKSTKFNDLPDDIKRMLEGIDSHIQGCLQISKDLHQRKLGEEPLKAQELLQGIRKDLMNISTQTQDDHHLAKDMKSKVDQAVQDTIVAIRLVDAFKAPQGSGTSYLNSHANFPLEYQIERKLSSSAGQAHTPQGISATLQAQHTTFLSLANKTAALDAEFQKIKTFYTQLYRAKTGSVRDPFNVLDRTSDTAEFGIHSLGVK